ncbi:hypothetical protein F4802DRAFT_194497 [Xylaria palmicola]|nr:hypothetical protein F4802DRAFT_194497 [Xylaria palmicola]
MASPTVFDPNPALPAVITSPPTAQFTPGPGCVDPEDHWAVVTSCAAVALGENSLSPSPDWLTCQVTQFGPPENGPASCHVPYSAQTVVDAETRFYSGCPSGYTGASTLLFTYSSGLESDVNVLCCPTQYNFNVDDYFTGDNMRFTTERDGVAYSVVYPLPGCATSYVKELSGKEIAVQTAYNTYGWEKRQVENVPWDYQAGTMYAEIQSYGYTVFHSTHTCYQDCRGWHDYYFSGSVQPPFTAVDTDTPFPQATGEPSSPTTPDGDSPFPQATVGSSSSTEADLPPTTSSNEPKTTLSPSETNGNASPSPTSTVSGASTRSATIVTLTRAILLGLLVSILSL